ncbi:hypothetical protein Tco_0214848 [Tanacetum coccineum]
MDWNRPPKEGDGAWHIRIELIGLDGLNPRRMEHYPRTSQINVPMAHSFLSLKSEIYLKLPIPEVFVDLQ